MGLLVFSLAFPGFPKACLMEGRLPVWGRNSVFVLMEGKCPWSWPTLNWPLSTVVWEETETPKYFQLLLQAVQMSGVSGDKLCRFLPLPSLLSHFHYLPFVEAVIYCILQPCNLWLFYNSFRAFRSNSSMYPSAFHCHTWGFPTSPCTSTLFL